MPFVSASEKWLCSRVGITHAETVDVTVLKLPGTYREKICQLNRSLVSFAALRDLQLSNNALTTLDGLQALKCLQTLNLYNNSVRSIQEVFRLRHNANLQALDLRLNPVTTGVASYRLFVVHMLPRIRTLDKRSVRARERQAALHHFATEQAAGFASAQCSSDKAVPQCLARSPDQLAVPRRKLVASLASHPTALDEDVELLVDLVQEAGGDLRQPLAVSGHVGGEHYAAIEIPEQDRIMRSLSDEIGGKYGTSQQHVPQFDVESMPHPMSRATPDTEPQPAAAYHAGTPALPYYVRGHTTHRPRQRDTTQHTDQQPATAHCARATVLNDRGSDAIDDIIVAIRDHSRTAEDSTALRATLISKLRNPNVWASLARERDSGVGHDGALAGVNQEHTGADVRIDSGAMCRHCQQVQEQLATTEGNARALHTQVVYIQTRAKAAEDALIAEKQKRRRMKKYLKEMTVVVKEAESISKQLKEAESISKQLEESRQAIAMLQESQTALVTCNDRLLLQTDDLRRQHQVETDELHWNYQRQIRKLKKNLVASSSTSS